MCAKWLLATIAGSRTATSSIGDAWVAGICISAATRIVWCQGTFLFVVMTVRGVRGCCGDRGEQEKKKAESNIHDEKYLSDVCLTGKR